MTTIFQALNFAINHHQAGRLSAAEEIYRQILSVEPNNADANQLLGVAALQSGNLESAHLFLCRAIEVNPLYAEAHNNLGLVLKKQKRLDEAVSCFRRALEIKPTYAAAHNNLGNLLKDQMKLDEALASFFKALELKADYAEAHNNLGNVLKIQGNLAGASASYIRALELNPDYAEAHNNLGAVRKEEGRLDDAESSFRRAVELKPDFAEAYNNLSAILCDKGNEVEAVTCNQYALELNPNYAPAHNSLGILFNRQGKSDEALASFRRALELKEEYAEAHFNLANILMDLDKLDDSVISYRRTLELKPDYVEAHNNLGTLLFRKEEFTDAIVCYRRAIEINADFFLAHFNLGKSLKRLGQLEAAIESFRRALELLTAVDKDGMRKTVCETYRELVEAANMLGNLQEAESAVTESLKVDPEDVDSRLMRGYLHLQSGRFELGWQDYELRRHGKPSLVQLSGPEWDGSPQPDKTILLVAEQGLGDCIQFIRYASLVRQRVGRVIFLTFKPLMGLMRLCPYVDEVYCGGSSLPRYDYHIPLLSLPLIFQTSMATVPREVPYLFADDRLIECWREKLSEITGFRIAIAWQGNREFAYDKFRRVPLREFERLASLPGVQLISVQKGEAAEQLKEIDFKVHSFDELDTTEGAFMDSAAIMKNVDLVISSCTATPHLAGALGVPVWLAKSFVADWRWLADDRPANPWYPTMQMFRQPKLDDWGSVFAMMAEAITNLSSGRESKGRVG